MSSFGSHVATCRKAHLHKKKSEVVARNPPTHTSPKSKTWCKCDCNWLYAGKSTLVEDIINWKMHAITLSPQPWILSKRPFTRVAHKLRPGWKHTFRSHHATGLEHGLRWRRHNLFWSWSVKIRVIRGCAGYSYSSWWCSGNLVQSKVTDRWVSDSELGKQGSRIRISRASCPSSTPLAASHCRFGTRRWGKWWLTV